jgi:hypothetical protein
VLIFTSLGAINLVEMTGSSHYQVNNAIETYSKNMKRRTHISWMSDSGVDDFVAISKEGVRRMLLERAEVDVNGPDDGAGKPVTPVSSHSEGGVRNTPSS